MTSSSITSLPGMNLPLAHYPSVELCDGLELRMRRVHEVTGPAADMFAVLSAAKRSADIVWIGLGRDMSTLCPLGLERFLSVESLIIVEAVSRGEILWAADQVLRAGGGFTVIIDMPDALSLKESRRLQLAAEQGGGLGLLILRGPAGSSAAQTRWRCAPLSSDDAAWRWQCVKGKNGEAGVWQVQYREGQNAEDTLHLAATASA